MLIQEGIKDLINRLEKLNEELGDDSLLSMEAFASELNGLLQVNVKVGDGSENMSIGYLLSASPGDLGFDLYGGSGAELLLTYQEELEKPTSMQNYFDSLSTFLTFLAENPQNTTTTGFASVPIEISIRGTEGVESSVEEAKSAVTEWNQTSVGDIPFDSDNPKVTDSIPGGQTTLDDADPTKIRKGSKNFYTGSNVEINELDEYTDVEGQVLKYPEGHPKAGEPITPHFYRGQAADVFEGLSAHQTFIIQQQLMELGMDISKIDDFTPGVIDFQSANSEINFLAIMMQSANDLQAQFPNAVFIDYDSPSVMGQLVPYIDFKKSVDRDIDVPFEKELAQYGAEVLPPTETEVKTAIDELFFSKGLTPTAQDYQKYGGIITGLRSQAAARELEIEKNQLTLTDIMGLSQGEYSLAGGKELQDVSFGVSLPSPEEAREQLGKPLLTPFDITAELEKTFERQEGDRILGGQELMNRKAQVSQFRKNFMEFEDAF